MSNVLQSKRFVIRKSLVGKNTVVEVTFKNGKTAKYNHDKAFAIMKDGLESLACYTASNNIPKELRDQELL